MKNYKPVMAALALAIVATEQAAQASLTSEVTGSGNFVFGDPVSSTIVVSYDVVFDSSSALYTYIYSFTPLPGADIGQFTINAKYVNSVLTLGTTVSGAPYVLTGTITDSGTSLGNVSWVWSPYTASRQLVGFTSLFGPSPGSGSLNDDTQGPWGDNPGSKGTSITVPELATVPEASTFVAGVLMLLPFGVSLVRCIRNKRTVKPS